MIASVIPNHMEVYSAIGNTSDSSIYRVDNNDSLKDLDAQFLNSYAFCPIYFSFSVVLSVFSLLCARYHGILTSDFGLVIIERFMVSGGRRCLAVS